MSEPAAGMTASIWTGLGRGRAGSGTTLAYTEPLRAALPGLLARYGVRNLLDAPCGPFEWLAGTVLPGVEYVGIDASARMVVENLRAHADAPGGGGSRQFLRRDVVSDPLPAADLLMCRGFLPRLPYAAIEATLRNFLRSGIPLLLVSSHRNGHNRDVEAGEWRQLNLRRPPFDFPEPLEELEDWIEGHPRCGMALWSREAVLAAMPAALVGEAGEDGKSGFAGHSWARRDAAASPVPAGAVASCELDFVTVVYRPELSLLWLQARSMAVNLDPTGVRRIHVVVNEDEPEDTVAAVRAFAGEYGPFEDRLTVWNAADISSAFGGRGWRTQQSLKLLAARHVAAEKYVVLDAKNHFVRRAGVERFLAEDGRPWSFWTVPGGNQRNFLLNTLRYLGLDPALADGRVMPTVTPYTLYASAVRSLLDEVEATEGVSFEEAFHAPGRDMTEFFLYYASLVRRGVDPVSLYAFGLRLAVSLFTRHPDTPERLAAMLDRMDDPGILLFGLHRNRIVGLDPATRARIEGIWVRGKLFAGQAEAAAFYERLVTDVSGADGLEGAGG